MGAATGGITPPARGLAPVRPQGRFLAPPGRPTAGDALNDARGCTVAVGTERTSFGVLSLVSGSSNVPIRCNGFNVKYYLVINLKENTL